MPRKLGELLVANGAVAEADVAAALAEQRAEGGGKRIGERLVASGKTTFDAVARALAIQFEIPFINLPEIPSRVSELVPLDLQREHGLIPFRLEGDGASGRLHVAISDPAQQEFVEELRFQIGMPLVVYVAAVDDVEGVLTALTGGDADSILIEEDDQEGAVTVQQPVPGEMPPVATLPEEWSIAPVVQVARSLTAPLDPPAAPVAVELSPILVPLPKQNYAPRHTPVPAAWSLEEPAAVAPVAAPRVKAAPPPDASWGEPWEWVAPTRVSASLPPSSDIPSSNAPIAVALAPEPGATTPVPVPMISPATVGSGFGVAPVAVEEEVPVDWAEPDPPSAPAPSAPANGATALEAPTPLASPVAVLPAAASPVASASMPASAAPMPAPRAGGKRGFELSDDDLQVLNSIEQLAQGQEAFVESPKVKPAQMVAALIRLLIHKGIIEELEFLEELARK